VVEAGQCSDSSSDPDLSIFFGFQRIFSKA
jgi:hypothetical protein